ncbi:hypothetical protein VRB50_22295 [Pseudomonas poae]|uniref:plasmid fertility inhibition factor family protein n=1 Tax=Pseudomonas poae TaxID=200451 RepID=UPI0030CCB297
MSQDDELFHVQLGKDHPNYQSVVLRRRPGYVNYEVVEVDTEKLIHYSNQDIRGYVLAPVEDWQPAKREGIFCFLAPPGPREQPVEMPVISFNERDVVQYERKWRFFKKAVVYRLKYIGYTNGRHRTRYLYFAGAKRIPVMCHISEVDALKAHCAP